jgi:hypothetical protein
LIRETDDVKSKSSHAPDAPAGGATEQNGVDKLICCHSDGLFCAAMTASSALPRWHPPHCCDGILRTAATASSALPRRRPPRFSDGILHPAATASSVLPRRVLRAAGMTSSVLPRRHRPRCWDGILRSLPVARFVPSNTHLCPFDVPSNALVCPPPLLRPPQINTASWSLVAMRQEPNSD